MTDATIAAAGADDVPVILRFMEWWVLDWNEPALRFYRSLGAEPMSDWTVQRLTGDALSRLAREDSRNVG